MGSLPAKPLGKPKNTGVSSLSLFQYIFLKQELNQFPTLQADSLPTELSGKPIIYIYIYICVCVCVCVLPALISVTFGALLFSTQPLWGCITWLRNKFRLVFSVVSSSERVKNIFPFYFFFQMRAELVWECWSLSVAEFKGLFLFFKSKALAQCFLIFTCIGIYWGPW